MYWSIVACGPASSLFHLDPLIQSVSQGDTDFRVVLSSHFFWCKYHRCCFQSKYNLSKCNFLTLERRVPFRTRKDMGHFPWLCRGALWITHIGDHTFSACSRSPLVILTGPNLVTHRNYAFANSSSLVCLTIPE